MSLKMKCVTYITLNRKAMQIKNKKAKFKNEFGFLQ